MRGSFIRIVNAMRGARAERVTTVHRSFLAAQWPEVHPIRYRPGGHLERESKSLVHSVVSYDAFRKTLWYKSAIREHSLVTGLATATGKDETSGTITGNIGMNIG